MTILYLQDTVYGCCDDDITAAQGMNIRIYHEREGRIERSVRRIAIWHHEACRVMTNGDPKGQIFLS